MLYYYCNLSEPNFVFGNSHCVAKSRNLKGLAEAAKNFGCSSGTFCTKLFALLER